GRTLLVHCEQGLGDTLQFIRFVRLAEKRGGKVLVEVQPALAPLLKNSGFGAVIPGGTPLPRFDVHAPLMSLPGLLGTPAEQFGVGVPYLVPDPKLLKAWRTKHRAIRGYKIGVAWQGNPDYAFDRVRSFPLAELAPLAEVPGVQIVSLQKGPGSEQVAKLA